MAEHDPSNIEQAFRFAVSEKRYFGLFYRDQNKPCYDEILRNQLKTATPMPRTDILNQFKI